MQDNSASRDGQYGLGKILTIWAIVAVPMPVLAFVAAPAWAEASGMPFGIAVWILMIAGMAWQFVVSVAILYRELDEFTWTAIRERIWLNRPRDPATGVPSLKLFVWLVPALLYATAIQETVVGDYLGNLVRIPFPFVDNLPSLDIRGLASAEYVGAWWLLGVAAVASVFNYFLGEELLFRGILLPKMRGVFGKWDWAANAVLFGLYHMHKPFVIVPTILGGAALSWTSARFGSIWFAIILHGVEGLFLMAMVFAVVSGLAF